MIPVTQRTPGPSRIQLLLRHGVNSRARTVTAKTHGLQIPRQLIVDGGVFEYVLQRQGVEDIQPGFLRCVLSDYKYSDKKSTEM